MDSEGNHQSHSESGTAGSGRGGWKKVLTLLAIGAVMAVAWSQYRDTLTLESLAAQEAELRAYQQDHPALVSGVAFLLYVLVTGLSLPGATILTLAFGWYFGFWRGVLLVSFASTSGATLAFLLSRYILRDAVQSRFGERLAGFNTALEREGAFYLFTLRLIPAVPFFVINVVMGLTPLRTWTYWWVSQVGMLAGTAVYVYAGASVPDLATLAERGAGGILSPQLIVAFVLLGLFPIVVRKAMHRFGPSSGDNSMAPVTDESAPTP
ncbi:TVP38/TMEM64 family protein [bacterium]|nr:TVP38/TMEM64 family protein [bacterium]